MQLFEPGEGGYPVFRIPGIVITKSGILIAYTEARSTPSDWANIDLVMKRSTDGGKTWEPLQVLVHNSHSESVTYNNPLMIAEKDNEAVHYLYCKNYHEVFYTKSSNGGLDWSSPVNITPTFNRFRDEGQLPKPYQWKVVATGPGHGIELRNGRLLVPVWLANGETDRSHGPSVIATVFSDDKGASWHAGEIIYNTPDVENPNETTAVELDEGSVMLNIRNNSSRRAIAVSRDGAQGWSVPKLNEALIDPKNFGSSARYSFSAEDGHSRILFINANDVEHRRNITLKMSEDEGLTWKYVKVIQPDQGAYSDIAISPKKTIHALYEQGFGIKSVILNKEWLMNGSELESLIFDTGKLSPVFRSDNRKYVLDVREDIALLQVTPKLPIHTAATIKVNGQAMASATNHIVTLNASGETLIRLLIESPQGEVAAEYEITVRNSLPKGALVGYWEIERITTDGITPDLSGLNNDGHMNGGCQVFGDKAMRFKDNHVDVAGDQGIAFGTGDFTAALWVMPEQMNDMMTLLWYGDVGAGARGWFLRTQEHNRLFFRVGGDGAQNLAATSYTELLASGRWTHMAAKRKFNEMTLYMDGREVLKKLTSHIFNVNGQNVLTVGKSPSENGCPWIGMIDEVRLYNYALTDREILQIYEDTQSRSERFEK
ncbi:exo-alpha-sialidase [Paenibacillus allorhizosphaerae]|nr:sialidase family protein [Paenibacillus allorhizosphaerae]